MLSFKIDDAISNFFDREKVNSALTRAEKKVYSQAGAFVRRTAKGSIVKGKKASKPGKPPKSHTGILKRFLFFAYDPAQHSVVIGPAKTNQIFFNGDGRPVSGLVPEVLEYGGSITILEYQNPRTGQWSRKDLRFRRTGMGGRATWKTRRRTVRIEARPYMGPALAVNAPKFPGLWADAITA
jgi:hypothetical protein